MSQPVSAVTLFERVGGEPAISAAVDRFSERVLADHQLTNFFSGVSMSRLKAHQLRYYRKL